MEYFQLGNITWVDALLVIVLVAVVASRFFKYKLPRDGRPREERKGWREVVERFQPQPKPAEATLPTNNKTQQLRSRGALVVPKGLSGMAALKAVDPTFNEAGFIKGAKDAYIFFHEKWAANDEDALHKLCAPRLLDVLLDGALGAAPGKVAEVKNAKIAGVRLNGRTAVVEVDFEATHGKAKSKKTLKSRWVLARAVGGLDPNWELQSFTPRK